MFHDLYHIAQLVRTAGALRTMGFVMLFLAGLGAAVIGWSHPEPAAQLASMAAFQVTGTLVLYVFLSDPLQWINYIFQILINIGIFLIRMVLTMFKVVLLVVLYLIYLVSPIDLIPGDLVTLIGVIDDIIIGLFVYSWVRSADTTPPQMNFNVIRLAPALRLIVAALATAGLIFLARQAG